MCWRTDDEIADTAMLTSDYEYAGIRSYSLINSILSSSTTVKYLPPPTRPRGGRMTSAAFRIVAGRRDPQPRWLAEIAVLP